MLRRKDSGLRIAGRFAGTIGLIVLGSCLVFGQSSTATISGVVKDGSGALVPGVSITVKQVDTGLTREAVGSESGGYNVPLASVGEYGRTTNMPGFKHG